MSRKIWGAAVVIVVLALLVVANASRLEARGQGVTFQNRSDSVQHVLARYGEEGACKDRPQKEQITLQKGEKVVLESGTNEVCWCASRAGKIGDCGDSWMKAKSGSYKRVF